MKFNCNRVLNVFNEASLPQKSFNLVCQKIKSGSTWESMNQAHLVASFNFKSYFVEMPGIVNRAYIVMSGGAMNVQFVNICMVIWASGA